MLELLLEALSAGQDEQSTAASLDTTSLSSSTIYSSTSSILTTTPAMSSTTPTTSVSSMTQTMSSTMQPTDGVSTGVQNEQPTTALQNNTLFSSSTIQTTIQTMSSTKQPTDGSHGVSEAQDNSKVLTVVGVLTVLWVLALAAAVVAFYFLKVKVGKIHPEKDFDPE